MTTPFTFQRRVEFNETDAAGIANFSSFIRYMEECEHALLRHLDFSVVWRDDEGTISWPRVAVSCEFQGAVRFEDVVDVAVSITRLGERSATYAFVFSHAGRYVARGQMTSVCCRIHHDRPPVAMAIPDWMRARLAAFAA